MGGYIFEKFPKLFLLVLPGNSETELAFDTDTLRQVKTEAESAKTKLLKTKTDTLASLSKLEAGWQTPAGRKFFEKLDRDWVTVVDKFGETMDVFSDMMEDLITIFQNIEDGANDIQF